MIACKSLFIKYFFHLFGISSYDVIPCKGTDIMRINNNIQALNVRRAITGQMDRAHRQIEIMSSGLRVRRAENDASGVSISEGLRSQVAGLSQNVRNTEQAADLLQVAEGGLQEVSKTLIHMRELVVRSADSTITDEQRQTAAAEFNQLRASIDRIAQATTYNNQILLAGVTQVVEEASTAVSQEAVTGVDQVNLSGAMAGTYTFVDAAGDETLTLGNGTVTQTLDLGTALDGNAVAEGTRMRINFDRLGVEVTLKGARAGASGDYVSGDLDGATLTLEDVGNGSFQVGPNEEATDLLELDLPDLRASSDPLGLGRVSVSSMVSARQGFSTLDLAIARVANERGKIGALQNRMSFSLSFSEIEIENMQSSESTIRDADMAYETSRYSRSLILAQSSQSMLVQAFDSARQALQLL